MHAGLMKACPCLNQFVSLSYNNSDTLSTRIILIENETH